MMKVRNLLAVLAAVMLLVMAVPLVSAQEDTTENEENVVVVTLADFSINVPESIPSGNVIFEISNEGNVEHSFRIEGPVEAELDTPLLPGETQQLEVNLEPGDYRIYSPLNDDATQGMDMQVTIAEMAPDVSVEADDTTGEVAAEQPEAAAEQATEAETTTGQETTQAEEPAALPQTGAVKFPLTETLLIGSGFALVIVGLGLAFGLRRHNK